MLGIEGDGMCRPLLSDLSVHGPLIIRESESCGRVINIDAISVRRLRKEKMCFLLFCSHTVFSVVALSHVPGLGLLLFFLFYLMAIQIKTRPTQYPTSV